MNQQQNKRNAEVRSMLDNLLKVRGADGKVVMRSNPTSWTYRERPWLSPC